MRRLHHFTDMAIQRAYETEMVKVINEKEAEKGALRCKKDVEKSKLTWEKEFEHS